MNTKSFGGTGLASNSGQNLRGARPAAPHSSAVPEYFSALGLCTYDCRYKLPYARHYKPRVVYFLLHFLRPKCLCKELFGKILTFCSVSI